MRFDFYGRFNLDSKPNLFSLHNYFDNLPFNSYFYKVCLFYDFFRDKNTLFQTEGNKYHVLLLTSKRTMKI